MNQRAVFFSEITDAVQVSDKSIHGKYAIRGNELRAGAIGVRGLQLGFQVGCIVILVAESFRLAQGPPSRPSA